jgi:hypothetical protein
LSKGQDVLPIRDTATHRSKLWIATEVYALDRGAMLSLHDKLVKIH